MSTRTTLTFPKAAPPASTATSSHPQYHAWPAPWPSHMKPMVVPPAQPRYTIVMVGKQR